MDDLNRLEASCDALPLDENHQLLFSSVMRAIEKPDTFTIDSIEKLKNNRLE